MTQESLTEKLATHLMRPVDEATRQRARLHLLDWLGCVAGGKSSNMGVNRLPADQMVAAKSPELILDRAALLGNILEMDDVHRTAILHPGPVIWPTALRSDNFFDAILDAAVRGYETTIAIGATFDQKHYSMYHNTTTAGVFGAVAVETERLELWTDRSALISALGFAGSVSGGLWQMRHEGERAKQWHIQHAITTAAKAVDFARSGNQGPRFILEGPHGIYAATCAAPKPMIFPEQWRIHDVSFKPWGACRHAHPAIDAALELKGKIGSLDGDILVETYADASAFCDRPDPQTVNDAKFSIQHAVAVVAQKGIPELIDFELDAIEAYAEARKRVTMVQADDITARYPPHFGARISCAGESVELVDTLGDPERPMSAAGIIGKARALISWGGLAESEADRAVDLALNGDDAAAIRQMLGDWLS